jgi:flagellar basal-body rod protein FlgG
MLRALNSAASGMTAQELNIEVIANNIANLRTTGYKRQRVDFQDMLYEHIRRIGTQVATQGNILPVGVDLGSGVKVVGTPRIMTQGVLTQTGNELDVAVQGEGFFKIQLPDGTFAYTRDGSFQLDNLGRIVTAQGLVVQPGITVPNNATNLTISNQGIVSVIIAGSTTPTNLGQFTLTRFINKAGLLPIGDNLFTESPASGPPQDGLPTVDGAGALQQGNLEQSNVQPVQEIADLIASQRAYEMNSKVISATDQMLQTAIGLYR